MYKHCKNLDFLCGKFLNSLCASCEYLESIDSDIDIPYLRKRKTTIGTYCMCFDRTARLKNKKCKKYNKMDKKYILNRIYTTTQLKSNNNVKNIKEFPVHYKDLLFSTKWYTCNDWTNSMLGNYPNENFENNKKVLGHEYKNIDSVLQHNLNTEARKLNIYVLFSQDKKCFYLLKGLEIKELDKNNVKIFTSKAPYIELRSNHGIGIDYMEGFYKIIIFG
jgi:hypothetical protein